MELLGDGVTVREYIFGEYLLLYALRGQDLYLLAIRHHRELSFAAEQRCHRTAPFAFEVLPVNLRAPQAVTSAVARLKRGGVLQA